MYILHCCSHLCLNFVQHPLLLLSETLPCRMFSIPRVDYVDRSCRFTLTQYIIITLSYRLFSRLLFLFFFFFFSNEFSIDEFRCIFVRFSLCKDCKNSKKNGSKRSRVNRQFLRSNLLHSLRTFQFGHTSVCSCYIIF